MKRRAATPQPEARPRRSSPPHLEVHLLGKFQVRRGDELIPDAAWARRSVSTLFKYVLLSPNHRCHKEQALDLLWPDLDPAAAANNLHKTLFYLRRTLYPEANDARECPYVEYDGEIITLDRIGSVDAEIFERQAQDAQAAHDLARYAATIELYAGDLLPDSLYADWTNARREALRQTYLKLLRRFGELQLAARDFASAIATFDRLLATDPADEAAHGALMKAYSLAGQRHQALRQYHTCCQALTTELDAGPMPETAALYQAILKGEVAPELTLASTLSMSPPALPLIGRATEVGTLMSALEAVRDGSPRLVLIAGEAGIGKTRLAHEATRLAHERGMPVLIGSTYEPVGALHEPPLPYGPFVEALRRFFSDQPIETRQQLIGPWQSDLAHLLPELSDEPSASTIEPEAAKRRLFDAVAHVLKAIATIHPVLLVLDDLHAADQATFDLLGYLLHRSPPVRVCVLALAREEGIDTIRYAPLTDLLARVGRRGSL
ncbi:MAG: AAA family ATPase, partial [Chloroflexi bacterium]|nr:AAA family ATPase [Chloroflexota bacterium]